MLFYRPDFSKGLKFLSQKDHQFSRPFGAEIRNWNGESRGITVCREKNTNNQLRTGLISPIFTLFSPRHFTMQMARYSSPPYRNVENSELPSVWCVRCAPCASPKSPSTSCLRYVARRTLRAEMKVGRLEDDGWMLMLMWKKSYISIYIYISIYKCTWNPYINDPCFDWSLDLVLEGSFAPK